MIFTELRFFYFLAIVLALYWMTPWWRMRKIFLLLASYVFYGVWDYRFLSLILISTVCDYLVGLGLDRDEGRGGSKGAGGASVARRRLLLLTSLVVNLGLLGFFKYFNFFVDSAADFLNLLGFEPHRPTLNVILPVGISFYTFQTLSYTIDIYRGDLRPTRDLPDFALFVAFFPQLVAGPIVRAAHFMPQLVEKKSAANINYQRWLTLFLIGFVKKACVADHVAPQVDAFFAKPDGYAGASAWIAVALYAVQIYCDFSGYSDMAIATAGMLGFRVPINFSHPYFAPNIADFWRRWHISLSSWLRDYLYIPLGGNRRGRRRTYINLMLTMVLGGLWHGAAWTFVIWGFLHGIGLAIHKAIFGDDRRDENLERSNGWARLPGTLANVVLTFAFVCLGWVFFRSASLAEALTVLGRMTFNGAPAGEHAIPNVYAIFFTVVVALHYLAYRIDPVEWGARLPAAVFAPAYGCAAALAIALMSVQYTPFIYFQF